VEIINSEQNRWIKKIKALQKRKYRDEYQQFVIEGSRFCQEALHHGARIEALLVSEKTLKFSNIEELLKHYSQKYYVIDSRLLEKSLSTVNPQGIAAIVDKPKWEIDKALEGNLIVIVDGVQDPGNLGTIIRTALGAEVNAVFGLKGTVDLYNDKTLRSTMGAVFNLPVFYIEDKDRLIELLNKYNFKLIVADINAAQYYYSVSYPHKAALVLGNEATGPVHIKQGDLTVKIPLNYKVESLNVAVAGGIILYEIVRQRMA